MKQETANDITKLQNLGDFCKYSWDHKEFGEVSPSEIPTTPPSSPEQALLIRKLVFSTSFGFQYLQNKRDWIYYWFSCCQSEKCDYIFTILANYEVDREKDILTILTEGNVWWDNVDGDYGQSSGKAYYLRETLSFLLQRYSCIRACRLFWKYRKQIPLFGPISLLLPRFLALIVVGSIFFSTSPAIWQLPTRVYNFSKFGGFTILLLLLIASVAYLAYKCRIKIEVHVRFWKAFMDVTLRVLPVFFMGFIWSLLINGFVMRLWILPAFEASPSLVGNEPILIPLTMLYFILGSLVVGIYGYSFWDEKSPTEPL